MRGRKKEIRRLVYGIFSKKHAVEKRIGSQKKIQTEKKIVHSGEGFPPPADLDHYGSEGKAMSAHKAGSNPPKDAKPLQLIKDRGKGRENAVRGRVSSLCGGGKIN